MENGISEKKKKNKLLFYIIYIFAILAVMLILVLREDNLANMADALHGLSGMWFWLAILCSCGFLFTEGFSVYFTTRWVCPESKVGFLKSLRTALIGQFYASITPSATGGQPLQIIDMTHNGISVGHGTSIMVIRFITHEAGIFVMTLIGFITQYDYISKGMPTMIPFGLLGIVLALGCIALVVAATLSHTFTRRLLNGIERLMVRFRLTKDPEKLHKKFDDALVDFGSAGRYLAHHPVQLVVLTLLDMLFLGLMFTITFCLYRAFGLSEFNYFKILCLQAFVHSMVYFFPLPGASGASEGGFMVLFRQVFSGKLVLSVMLIWRLLTYYARILFGFIAVLWSAGDHAREAVPKNSQEEM